MASRGRGRRGHPRGTGQAPPAFDQPPAFNQHAFTEAVGIAITAIAQACALVSQGGSSDLQHLEAHQPPLGREGGVDDMRGIQDMGVGTKRKEDPSSSNPGRSRRLLFREDIQDRAEVIRTKARMGQLVRQGR